MLVTLTGFGSVWRRRWGRDPSDPKRYARAAYFNTTGVPVNGKIRTRPKIAGHARFNGVGGFNPNYPLRMINSVFECAEPCVWQGQNKVLFKRMLSAPVQPDYHLVVVKACEVGRMDVASPSWRSDDTLLISLSECRDQQEAMLLMPAYSWLRTALATFVLEPFKAWPWSARLRLQPPEPTGTKCAIEKDPSS
jgi:hypothetical protein